MRSQLLHEAVSINIDQVNHFFKANEPRAQAFIMILSLAFQLAEVLPGFAEEIIDTIHKMNEVDDDQTKMDPNHLFDRLVFSVVNRMANSLLIGHQL